MYAKIVSVSIFIRLTARLIRFYQIGVRVEVDLKFLILVLIKISQASERPNAVVVM